MKTGRFPLAAAILIASLSFHYVPLLIRGEGVLVLGLIQDITSIYGFLPWDTFSLRELGSGLFPLWNNLNALGEPHLANMQTALFYPISWLRFLVGMDLRALDIILLLRLFIAGGGTYVFARRWKVGTAGSLVAALSFMLTGYFTRHVYMSHLNVETLIPAVMIAFGELARSGGWRWFPASIAATWLAIVGGFPEATFYALTLGTLFFLWAAPPSRWPLLVGAGLVGTLAASAQLLPFFEYVANGWFYHPPGVGLTHLDVKYFFALWSPWFFGANDVSPLAPFLFPYLGLVPIALAITALQRGMDGTRLFLLGAAMVCVGLVYGLPPFSWLGYLPVFDLSLNYKYAIPPAAFCVAVLAGMGADDVLNGIGVRKCIIASTALITALVLAVIADRFGAFKPFFRLADALDMLKTSAAGIALIIAAGLAGDGKRKYAAPIIVIAAAMLPVWGNKQRFDTSIETNPTMAEMDYFHRMNYDERFTAQDHILFPDTNLLEGIRDFRYYNPMYTKSYASAIARINGLEDDEQLRQHFAKHAMLMPEESGVTSPLLDTARVDTWIGEGPPGAKNLMPLLESKADWRARNSGMIMSGTVSLGYERRPMLLAHAPAAVSIELSSKSGSSLRFRPLMHPGADCSDGSWFTVLAGTGEETRVLFAEFISTETLDKEITLPLTGLDDGAELIFLTSPGPLDDNGCDWAAWAAPSMGNMEPEGWERRPEISDRLWSRTPVDKRNDGDDACSPSETTAKIVNTQRIEIDPEGCNSGRVISSTAYYPGWRAYDAGGEVRIEKYDGIFQSVGTTKKFTLLYEPWSFRVGLWASLGSLLSLGIAIVLRKNMVGMNQPGGG